MSLRAAATYEHAKAKARTFLISGLLKTIIIQQASYFWNSV